MPGPYSPADPRHYFGFARQATKGTAVTPALFARYQDEAEFAHNPQITPKREAGAGFAVARSVKDVQANSARLVVPFQPDVGAAIMALILGDDQVSAGPDPFTHTITPTVAMNWITAERNLADELIERLVDAVFTNAEVRIQKRDASSELSMIADLMGLTVARQTVAATEAYEADAPYVRSQATWTVDGSASTNCESATLRIGWNYDDAMLADAVTRVNTIKLQLNVEVELVQLFASQDELDAYIATHYDANPTGLTPGETILEGDLTVAFSKGVVPNRSVTFTLPRVTWTDARVTEGNPSGNEGTRLTRTGFAAAPAAVPVLTVTALNGRSTSYTA